MTGGTAKAKTTSQPGEETSVAPVDAASFEYVDSPTLAKLQGTWSAVKIVQDGQELPSFMCASGLRTATKNELKVTVAGQVVIHALMRLDESRDPVHIDYYHIAGPVKGIVQLGIMKWSGSDLCSYMSQPGAARPADFTCSPGSGHTFSQWRPAKK